MPIEVRQIVVRASVGEAPRQAAPGGADAMPGLTAQQLERLLARTKREVLAQCRALLEERLARPGER